MRQRGERLDVGFDAGAAAKHELGRFGEAHLQQGGRPVEGAERSAEHKGAGHAQQCPPVTGQRSERGDIERDQRHDKEGGGIVAEHGERHERSGGQPVPTLPANREPVRRPHQPRQDCPGERLRDGAALIGDQEQVGGQQVDEGGNQRGQPVLQNAAGVDVHAPARQQQAERENRFGRGDQPKSQAVKEQAEIARQRWIVLKERGGVAEVEIEAEARVEDTVCPGTVKLKDAVNAHEEVARVGDARRPKRDQDRSRAAGEEDKRQQIVPLCRKPGTQGSVYLQSLLNDMCSPGWQAHVPIDL